jgi:hypothetical protein
MSALYSHAIRWEWTDRNPITSVRQSGKRQKAPAVLTPDEIVAILKELPDPLRTMVELNAFTGLRRGRTHRTSLGRRGIRGTYPSCPKFGGSKWIMKKNGRFRGSSLFCWRPKREDFEPNCSSQGGLVAPTALTISPDSERRRRG